MKKVVLTAFAACISAFAMAGGVLTNTNQNAAFLRHMSQDAIIDINGLYMNPAGTAFLKDGWHLNVSLQNAKQSRDIITTFPLFQYNVNNRNATHEFEGDAYAPVIPGFMLSYNHGKWSVNANFAISGGGGKCEFDKGLGSFEALYSSNIFSSKALLEGGVKSVLPGMVKQELITNGKSEAQADMLITSPGSEYNAHLAGYGMDAYMKGRQYFFGLQLGATYKALDNLAFYLGLRGVYANCNYNGYVQDIKATVAYDYAIPAAGLNGNGSQEVDLSSQSLALNCDQKGFGVTPILGVDWRVNEHWNLAAKYEFETKMRLKNKTEMNEFAKSQVAGGNETLAQFEDDKKVAANIAGILTLGAQYSPIEKVRMNAGFHYYFDKAAKQYGNKQGNIDKNTWEVITGAEWDICKYFTLSASWQRTKYGFSDAYMNDLSFNLSCNSLGVGFRINANERVSVDFGYMHTFYQDRNVATLGGLKSDLYHRTNRVFGLGVNVDL